MIPEVDAPLGPVVWFLVGAVEHQTGQWKSHLFVVVVVVHNNSQPKRDGKLSQKTGKSFNDVFGDQMKKKRKEKKKNMLQTKKYQAKEISQLNFCEFD